MATLYEQIAIAMYDAYGADRDWKTFDGRDMPATFAALGEGVQSAWKAAAKAAVDQFELDKPGIWREQFDARANKEIDFAKLYAKDFIHGTDGHNRLLIIAKLADLLDGKKD